MSFIDEKAKRVKYIRALEKFAKSTISALKREDFDEVQFYDRVGKNAKILEKLEPVYLDSPYTKALENFVNQAVQKVGKTELLRDANLLEKLKNQKNYKKDKHKNKFKDDV
ncbi:hypothetical protein [Campylobacter mucosalis]|uniref:hypothetical protein n=1 Tax=Campylobacter mucosalis TaxID=202 RepID=UPI00146FF3F2|nr:hypothetical protein [Campylobacter mucosalis]